MSVPDGEVAFLILHYLRTLNGGDRLLRASADLESAFASANLLPSEPDFTGASRTLSYEDCTARFSHVPANYLTAALAERIPRSSIPVRTLFGQGDFTTVPRSLRPPNSAQPSSMQAAATKQTSLIKSEYGLQSYQKRFGWNTNFVPALLEQMLTLDRPLPTSKLMYSLVPKQMRRLKRLVGHENNAYCVQYDFSSEYIVTGSDDQMIKVWCAKTGYLRNTLRGHDGDINDIVAVPGHRLIVSASPDSTVRVWDIVTGENLHVLRGGTKQVHVVQFSPCPSRPYLLAACADGVARLWNANNYAQGELRIPLPVSGRRGETAATSGANPDGNNSRAPTIGDSSGAGAGERDSIPASSPPNTPMEIASPPVTANSRTGQSIQRQRNGLRATTTGHQRRARTPADDVAVRLPGPQTGASSRQQVGISNTANSVVSGTPAYEVLSVTFNSGATRLAFSGTDGMAHVYAVDKGKASDDLPIVRHLTSLRGHSEGIYQVTFARHGDRICTASHDGTAKVWRRVRARLPRKKRAKPVVGAGVWDSKLLDCRVQHQDVRSNLSMGASATPSTSITPRVNPHLHLGKGPISVDAVMWSLDDGFIVSASSDTKIRVWNSETGDLRYVLQAHDRKVYVIDAHPFDKRIVLTAGYEGRCVLWDIENGTELRRFSVARPGVSRNPAFASVLNEVGPSISDGKFAPDGLSFSATDASGGLTIFGVDCGLTMERAPEEQYFSSDFRSFRKDAQQRAISDGPGILLHLEPKGYLCDSQSRRHPAELQIGSHRVLRPSIVSPGVVERNLGCDASEFKRDALVSRAEQFRARERTEEKRLIREARALRRRKCRERQKVELEMDIAPGTPIRDFVVPDSDRDSDGDFEIAEEEERSEPESGSSEEDSTHTNDGDEYRPRFQRLIRRSAREHRKTRKKNISLRCTCVRTSRKNGPDDIENQSDRGGETSDDGASFHINSGDDDTDGSYTPDGPAKSESVSKRQATSMRDSGNLQNTCAALPRMTIHLTRSAGQAVKTDNRKASTSAGRAFVVEARPSSLNRSFTSERQANNNPKSPAEKSVDMEMPGVNPVEPAQTSRDSFTNKEPSHPQHPQGDVRRWSVQSKATDGVQEASKIGTRPTTNTVSKGSGRILHRKSGSRSGSRRKNDSDSDFDPSEFYVEEELNSKTGDPNTRNQKKSRKRNRLVTKKLSKRLRRNTRSLAKREKCPVHSRAAPNRNDVTGNAVLSDGHEDSEDSDGSLIIRRKRRRYMNAGTLENTAAGSKRASRELSGNDDFWTSCIRPDPSVASQWLRTTDQSHNYIPQRGDIVYYFPCGHVQAICRSKSVGINPFAVAKESVSSREKTRLDGSMLTERKKPLRFVICNVSYEFPCSLEARKENDKKEKIRALNPKPLKHSAGQVVALLTLRKEDTGVWPQDLPNEVILPYYPVDDVPEYVVLASRVHRSLACNWKSGDKFRMLFVNEKRVWQYYTGSVQNVSSETSGMGWNSVSVEFDNEEDPDREALEKVSPWELEPLNITQSALLQTSTRKKYISQAADVPPAEPRLFMAIANEIGTCQTIDTASKSHISWMRTIGTLCKSPEYCKAIPCPIDLDLVLTRLCTGFYRHFQAFVDDVELLRSNTILFKGRDSEEARISQTVYSLLLGAGEKAKQKFVRDNNATALMAGTSASGTDSKARNYPTEGTQSLSAVAGSCQGRNPYIPLAPRMGSLGVASSREGPVLPDVVGNSSTVHGAIRGVHHIRNTNGAHAMTATGAPHAGLGSLPPIVPSVLMPPSINHRATSRSYKHPGRTGQSSRLHSSPVHRGRGLSSGINNIVPGFPVHLPAPGGQATSSQMQGMPSSHLVHPVQRTIPIPVQIPIAPRIGTRSNFSHPASIQPLPNGNFSARPVFGPVRNNVAPGSNLSTLLAPGTLGNGGAFSVGEAPSISNAGPSPLANVNGMFTNYGASRAVRNIAVADGGTRSCGGSMEAAGGGGGSGHGSTSESRVPTIWPQQPPYSLSTPFRSVTGGASAARHTGTGANNMMNSATLAAPSPPGLYQENSSISVVAAESTMSCGGENGISEAAIGESHENR